jgi:hypothetical protein
MILNRFFRPKSQQNDPRVRLQALQKLLPDDPALADFAQRDEDPAIRCAALNRLTAITLVQHMATADASPEVRETAAKRFRDLLAGAEPQKPTLQERLAVLPSLEPALVEFLAVHAKEAELRMAALGLITDEALLTRIAIHDPTAAVRFAALAHVRQTAALEEIAKHSRNRDKRIFRTARERLDAARDERQRTTLAERLCQEMENLTWDGAAGIHAGRFPRLELEWRQVQDCADEILQARFAQARARFVDQRQRSTTQRIAQQDACATLEACAERLRTATEWTPDVAAAVADTLRNAQRSWDTDVATDDVEGKRLSQRFADALHAIGERERVLQRNHERAVRLREVLHHADVLVNQPGQVLEPDITSLKHQWTSLERPESGGLATQLQHDFDAALEKLRVRQQRQIERRDQEWQELQERVDAVEQALEEGELQKALELHKQARQHLKQNIALSRQQMSQLEHRLEACAPRLGELRGWRRWGTHQAREQLCEEAERLVAGAAEPLATAQRIKDLRLAWKHLDGTEGAASRTLWKRFDKACEQAYEPCQAFFQAQTQERQRNLGKKQALCQQLEEVEAHTDWQQVDWREADRLWRDAQKRWHKLGPVNRADKKSLDRRFEAALRRLDAHLQQEREREIGRRRLLINRVRELLDGVDAQAAVDAAKRAQAEWQPTVQADRRDEQALWQQFREVCDAAFERRQMEHQAADAEREANLARKEALCAALEALVADNRQDRAQIEARLQDIREQWAAIGAVPKAAYRTLEKRLETATAQAESHIRALRRQHDRQTLHSLHERARLCARLEELLFTPTPEALTVMAAAQDKWQRLLPVAPALAGGIQLRFDTACRALSEGGARREALLQQLAANLEQKHKLCLRMEIVAGVESPPEFAQARMECQVSRLSETLGRRDNTQDGGVDDEVRRIEAAWYLLGVSPDQEAALGERFRRALAALH